MHARALFVLAFALGCGGSNPLPDMPMHSPAPDLAMMVTPGLTDMATGDMAMMMPAGHRDMAMMVTPQA